MGKGFFGSLFGGKEDKINEQESKQQKSIPLYKKQSIAYYRTLPRRNLNIESAIIQRDFKRKLQDQKQSKQQTNCYLLLVGIIIIAFLFTAPVTMYFRHFIRVPQGCRAEFYDITNYFTPICEICYPGYQLKDKQCYKLPQFPQFQLAQNVP